MLDISESRVAVQYDRDKCIKCGTCYSVCPFEAISPDLTNGKFNLDIEKCQVCGLCASVCPAYAIESKYYDYKQLADYVASQVKTNNADTLGIMCRGSSTADGTPEALEKLNNLVTLRVPCVGRIPAEFYLESIASGIGQVVVVQCDEDFCRFKEGSKKNIRQVNLLKATLKQLGYPEEMLKIVKSPSRAVYKTANCVGCDKCEFICPFDAIELQSLGTPQIMDACKGCGACAVVCPHLAIQVKGFEYETASKIIQQYSAEAKSRKARDASPAVLAFCCQWAEFQALDNHRDGGKAFIMEIPCLTKLDAALVIQALNQGFDGVMAYACSDEDCKLKEGRLVTNNSIEVLKLILSRLGLANRFEVFQGSPRYIGDFDTKVNSFVDKIAALEKKV